MKKLKFMKLLLLAFIVGAMSASSAKAQLINTVVSLTGSVFDAVSKQPVTAIVYIEDENGKRINATRSNSAENGYYYLTGLRPGNTYKVHIVKKSYFKDQFDLTVPLTDKYKEISKDFLVKPKEKGVKIPLPVPPFELNKVKLRYGAEELIASMESTLKNNPQVKFEIQCFPDNEANPEQNLEITTSRCKALMNYFAQNGIAQDRMTMQGNKETDPNNPPPMRTQAKGKRYIGTTYIVVKDF
jgi:outer membrane protein OmpA-like peptidoglycan-associated protein